MKELIGKTISDIVYSNAYLKDGGDQDIITLHFTDGTEAILSAHISESPSSHWGDGARIDFEMLNEQTNNDVS